MLKLLPFRILFAYACTPLLLPILSRPLHLSPFSSPIPFLFIFLSLLPVCSSFLPFRFLLASVYTRCNPYSASLFTFHRPRYRIPSLPLSSRPSDPIPPSSLSTVPTRPHCPLLPLSSLPPSQSLFPSLYFIPLL